MTYYVIEKKTKRLVMDNQQMTVYKGVLRQEDEDNIIYSEHYYTCRTMSQAERWFNQYIIDSHAKTTILHKIEHMFLTMVRLANHDN